MVDSERILRKGIIMVKLAQTTSKVIVVLTNVEFKFLAKKEPSDVPDSTSVSLTWIKDLTDNIQQYVPFITAAQVKAAELATALGDMLP